MVGRKTSHLIQTKSAVVLKHEQKRFRDWVSSAHKAIEELKRINSLSPMELMLEELPKFKGEI